MPRSDYKELTTTSINSVSLLDNYGLKLGASTNERVGGNECRIKCFVVYCFLIVSYQLAVIIANHRQSKPLRPHVWYPGWELNPQNRGSKPRTYASSVTGAFWRRHRDSNADISCPMVTLAG